MAETTYASLLDNFTKERYSNIIVAEQIIEVPLLEALTENVDRANFDTNGNVKVLIQTQSGRNARGLTDGGNLPTARPSAYVEQTIPVERVLATCGLTEKVMKLLRGGQDSWGPMVGRTIDDMIKDFRYAQNIAAHSNGTGALARVSACAAFANGGHIITCDNTYDDSGIENTSIIQKDMYVSIWDIGTSAFVADDSGATEFLVTAVAPGKRDNSTYAATTGTFTITCSSDISGTVSDNDIVFLPGARDAVGSKILPMGVSGIIANNNTGTYDDDFSAPWNTATFQGLTRATYPCLQSDVWKATDFGLSSESPADGTPTLWDLSVFSDAMEEIGNRGGKTRLIRCHGQMARTMHRLNRTESGVQVILNTTKDQVDIPVIGSVKPKYFIDIDGDLVPIITDKYCPRYVVEGMDTSVMRWHPVGNADYRKDFGGIWGPTRGGRATTMEAGYEWWYELSSERCDWHWRIQDLRVDL
jgi:hypothetical protein